jgi:hypothetical protein
MPNERFCSFWFAEAKVQEYIFRKKSQRFLTGICKKDT